MRASFLGAVLGTALHVAGAESISPSMVQNMRVLQRAMDPGVFSRYQMRLRGYSEELAAREKQEEAEAAAKAAQQEAVKQQKMQNQRMVWQQQQQAQRQQQLQQQQQQLQDQGLMSVHQQPQQSQQFQQQQPPQLQQPQQLQQQPMQQFQQQLPPLPQQDFQMPPPQNFQPQLPPQPQQATQGMLNAPAPNVVFGVAAPPPAQPSVSYYPGQQPLPQQQQQQQQQPQQQEMVARGAQLRAENAQEQRKWQSPAIFSNYKKAMQQYNAPRVSPEVQKEYRVYEGQNVLCGPVPLRPIRLMQAGDLEPCRQRCSQLVTCVGFITDLAQSKCLFRSWDSLQTCKKRYHQMMQPDEKFVTMLKNDLILDGLN